MWDGFRTLRSDLSLYSGLVQATGGEGGIRTHDTLSGTPHFECGTFNHSATSPIAPCGTGRERGRYLARAAPVRKTLGALPDPQVTPPPERAGPPSPADRHGSLRFTVRTASFNNLPVSY